MYRTQFLTRLVAITALALAPAWASAELLTIGPDDPNSFFPVPRALTQLPTSAPVSATPVATLGDGSIGFNGGLAYDGSGLYAIGNDWSGASTLYSMTTTGASLTSVGALGSGFYGGLAHRSGALYAIGSDGFGASTLYQVTGGSATAVGSGVGFGFYGGLTYNADDDLLYAIAGDSSSVQRALYKVDVTSGAPTFLFNLGDGSIGFDGGLAYDDSADLFYAIGSDSFANSGLYSFTLAGNGAVTAIGSSFGQGFVNRSLAMLPGDVTPVPEPPTLALLSSLLFLGLVSRKGRRR